MTDERDGRSVKFVVTVLKAAGSVDLPNSAKQVGACGAIKPDVALSVYVHRA